MTRPQLSLVICTLDEALSIGSVLREAQSALAGIDFEIIVVDDSDDDRTASVVAAHAGSDQRIGLVRRRGARGLATAAIAGWDAARGDALAIMDGDGQHDVALLPSMLNALREQAADIVVASRYGPERKGGPSGLNARRHAMSRIATRATDLCLGAPVTDPMSGFFVMRRSFFEAARCRVSGVGFKILVDLIMSGPKGASIVELGTVLRKRLGGTSKLDTRVVIELAALLIEKRTGGVVSARFTLFGLVGFSGIIVNMAVLGLLEFVRFAPFWLAQGLAILAAMISNFALNNILTFRERRLRGWAVATGLLAFVASCAGGAALSEAVGTSVHQLGVHWVGAGLAGTVTAALWNYWSTTRSAWSSQRMAGVRPDASVRLWRRAFARGRGLLGLRQI